jgi:hypothetical protein
VSAQNENWSPVILDMYVLGIDCYWHGFGGIQDRFDSEIPWQYSLYISRSVEPRTISVLYMDSINSDGLA